MDAEALRHHLSDTMPIIERHRARLEPSGPTISDEPVAFTGFGPRSPCNEVALQAADSEAAVIGELALHCMGMGTLPKHSLACLWRPGGKIRGLMPTKIREFEDLIWHMKAHADLILSTPGIDWHLWCVEETRFKSLKMFPQEDSQWVGLAKAVEMTGRSKRTIRSWVNHGGVRSITDHWGTMVHAGDIATKMRLIDENQNRGGFRITATPML